MCGHPCLKSVDALCVAAWDTVRLSQCRLYRATIFTGCIIFIFWHSPYELRNRTFLYFATFCQKRPHPQEGSSYTNSLQRFRKCSGYSDKLENSDPRSTSTMYPLQCYANSLSVLSMVSALLTLDDPPLHNCSTAPQLRNLLGEIPLTHYQSHSLTREFQAAAIQNSPRWLTATCRIGILHGTIIGFYPISSVELLPKLGWR